MLSKRDQARLEVAKKVADLSGVRMRHGAAIYKSGRLLAVGKNSSRTHGKFITGYETNYSEHAEISAIRQCRKADLRGAVLYVARVNRNGKELMSRPCNKCAKAIISAGIKEVVYTTGDIDGYL